jgi:selenium-binding protein 1
VSHHEHGSAPRPATFYASPGEALQAPPEEFLYVACLHEGTGVEAPDFLAVVDAEEGRIVHETPMPNVGDELHHYGWNRCSSACHGPDRSHLIVPGFRSSRIHVVNVGDDPRRPRIEKVIEPEEVIEATGYTRPHTVHCMPGDNVVLSMLGDAEGNGAGGFAVLDAHSFELKGRWENGGTLPPAQLRLLVPAAQERPHLVGVRRAERVRKRVRSRRRRGRALRAQAPLLEARERRLEQTLDLGETGLIPLEVRWLHDPEGEGGSVGAALSSTMWYWHRDDGWPFPLPGLITDLVLSMDDRFLYFSNWLHGDLRQYDVSDPANPRLAGRLWLGGLLGEPSDGGRELNGGPQMLQLSLDGRRLYVTNSLYSTWDNQFYPGLRSWLLKIDIGEEGGMTVDPNFFLDLHERPDGPARAHEGRLQGGDCTTEIFP